LKPSRHTAHASTIETVVSTTHPLSEHELVGIQYFHGGGLTYPEPTKYHVIAQSGISLATVYPPAVQK